MAASDSFWHPLRLMAEEVTSRRCPAVALACNNRQGPIRPTQCLAWWVLLIVKPSFVLSFG